MNTPFILLYIALTNLYYTDDNSKVLLDNLVSDEVNIALDSEGIESQHMDEEAQKEVSEIPDIVDHSIQEEIVIENKDQNDDDIVIKNEKDITIKEEIKVDTVKEEETIKVDNIVDDIREDNISKDIQVEEKLSNKLESTDSNSIKKDAQKTNEIKAESDIFELTPEEFAIEDLSIKDKGEEIEIEVIDNKVVPKEDNKIIEELPKISNGEERKNSEEIVKPNDKAVNSEPLVEDKVVTEAIITPEQKLAEQVEKINPRKKYSLSYKNLINPPIILFRIGRN